MTSGSASNASNSPSFPSPAWSTTCPASSSPLRTKRAVSGSSSMRRMRIGPIVHPARRAVERGRSPLVEFDEPAACAVYAGHTIQIDHNAPGASVDARHPLVQKRSPHRGQHRARRLPAGRSAGARVHSGRLPAQAAPRRPSMSPVPVCVSRRPRRRTRRRELQADRDARRPPALPAGPWRWWWRRTDWRRTGCAFGSRRDPHSVRAGDQVRLCPSVMRMGVRGGPVSGSTARPSTGLGIDRSIVRRLIPRRRRCTLSPSPKS